MPVGGRGGSSQDSREESKMPVGGRGGGAPRLLTLSKLVELDTERLMQWNIRGL